MNRSKRAKLLIMLVFAALLLAAGLVPGRAASAAEAYDPLEAVFTYKHVFTTTDTQVDSLFHYVITPRDGAPLPAEADADGGFSFQGASGSGEKVGDSTRFALEGALTFTFTKPGVYSYDIKADLEQDSQKPNAQRYTFENRTLTINLYIVNAEDGGMKLQMLTAENSDVKLCEMELTTAYAGPVTPAPTPETGDRGTPLLYVAMIIFSGAAITALLAKKKGREDNA